MLYIWSAVHAWKVQYVGLTFTQGGTVPTYEVHVICGKHLGALLTPKLYSNFAHFRKDVNEIQNIYEQTIYFLLKA